MTTKTRIHIAKICQDAGLEIMEEILIVASDRDGISDKTFRKLTAADIPELYDNHIGPGIDKLEDDLMDR